LIIIKAERRFGAARPQSVLLRDDHKLHLLIILISILRLTNSTTL